MRTITIPGINVPVTAAEPAKGFPRNDFLNGLKYKVLTDRKPFKIFLVWVGVSVLGLLLSIAAVIVHSIDEQSFYVDALMIPATGMVLFGSVGLLVASMGGTREATKQFNLGLFQDWVQQRYNVTVTKDPKIIEALYENKSITTTLEDGTPVLLVVHDSVAKLYRLEGGELPVKETMFAA